MIEMNNKLLQNSRGGLVFSYIVLTKQAELVAT